MNSLKKKNKRLLDEIFSTLNEEVILYEDLAETAHKKQKSILENNVQSLAELTSMEQSCIRKGNRLTSKRLDMTCDIENGQKKRIMSLSSFLGINNLLNDDDWSFKVKRLNLALTKIKQLNLENSTLLNTSISFVQDLIRLYYPKNDPDSKIYTRDGKTETQKSTVLDCGV